MQTDWAIVGGGIHGVHIALRLLEEGGVSRDRLRIVDPADRLLTRWHECTRVTGMQYLRSSSVHHLATDAYALRRFAKSHRTRGAGQYAHPYDRPSLELFDDLPEAWLNLGALAGEQGRADVAKKAFSRAAEWLGGDRVLLMNRATAAMRLLIRPKLILPSSPTECPAKYSATPSSDHMAP